MFDAFKPMAAAPCHHDEHDLNLSSDRAQEIAPVSALALNPEQIVSSEDRKLNAATKAIDSAALEPHTDPASKEICVTGTSDMFPATGSEPCASTSVELSQSSILEFSSATFFGTRLWATC